eukprot:Skav209129  [mRNA]  locus=scaffold682:212108:221957:+ [translate_table: standard]
MLFVGSLATLATLATAVRIDDISDEIVGLASSSTHGGSTMTKTTCFLETCVANGVGSYEVRGRNATLLSQQMQPQSQYFVGSSCEATPKSMQVWTASLVQWFGDDPVNNSSIAIYVNPMIEHKLHGETIKLCALMPVLFLVFFVAMVIVHAALRAWKASASDPLAGEIDLGWAAGFIMSLMALQMGALLLVRKSAEMEVPWFVYLLVFLTLNCDLQSLMMALVGLAGPVWAELKSIQMARELDENLKRLQVNAVKFAESKGPNLQLRPWKALVLGGRKGISMLKLLAETDAEMETKDVDFSMRDMLWHNNAIFELTHSRAAFLVVPSLVALIAMSCFISAFHMTVYGCSYGELSNLQLASSLHSLDFSGYQDKTKFFQPWPSSEVTEQSITESASSATVEIQLPQHQFPRIARVQVKGLRTSLPPREYQAKAKKGKDIRTIAVKFDGVDAPAAWAAEEYGLRLLKGNISTTQNMERVLLSSADASCALLDVHDEGDSPGRDIDMCGLINTIGLGGGNQRWAAGKFMAHLTFPPFAFSKGRREGDGLPDGSLLDSEPLEPERGRARGFTTGTARCHSMAGTYVGSNFRAQRRDRGGIPS